MNAAHDASLIKELRENLSAQVAEDKVTTLDEMLGEAERIRCKAGGD